VTTPLSIYLRNHEAAARAGLDLFRRVARAQRKRSYGAELAALRDEVAADRATLLQIMRRAGVRPNRLLGLGLRLGERFGRLKPNGALMSRSQLSDLIELEGLADAVHAKKLGWRALLAADVDSREVKSLLVRARRQSARVGRLHGLAASSTLRRTRRSR
jgi:hypothetical protein